MEKAEKDQSMELQKKMLSDYYEDLSHAHETGKKVCYTFVPGNLSELMLSFDFLPVYPEINALQSGMRKLSGEYIELAEKAGHSEDVCTYVKCDIGMMLSGNKGPTGKAIPPPDLLLLSYTGCFTFLKWFENLKELYDCPIAMLHVPYQADGHLTGDMIKYVVKQLKEKVIPLMEQVTGKKYDADRNAELCDLSRQAEELFVDCMGSAKQTPSPIDGYFGGVYYISPIFTAFRGTSMAIDYYRTLKKEIEKRKENRMGPITPEGDMDDEKYRLVVEGPPNWTHFRDFWKLFYDHNAVVVASTYTRVGGIYDNGFRHDPADPYDSYAKYCLGCYTNLNMPQRVDLICKYVEEYEADGFLVNSIKSCNSFSAGQLMIVQEVEKRTGVTVGFIESDLVDPRYFSYAHTKNRMDSYFQMIDEKWRLQ
ncbi:MAG: benzoyl-CoA reductase subunit B [bacterium]|nr:benzoyl-CoA reductase subunit B [bacterium]